MVSSKRFAPKIVATEPVEDAWLATSAARDALLPRRKPYWHPIDKGLHIGYYKGARSSTWHARFFVGAGRYEETRLGTADDTHHADGRTVLDYTQAVARSLDWRKRHDATRVPANGSLLTAGKRRVRTDKLDEISVAWQRERPDLDLRLVGFFMRIKQASFMHEQRVAAIADAVGVNVGELHVLLALRRAGAPYAMRPTDLFRALLVTSGAMSKRIDGLESMRLVSRVADADDQRGLNIVLTREGIKIADAAIVRIAEGLAGLRKAMGMSQAEIREMDGYLRRLSFEAD
ncbi:hypothetical protein GCM10027093_71920 [Paraburkholderia jirisanensis]